MDHLRLAYSPCPNDTYIFHAWVHGLIPEAPPVEERLEDIDTLNRLALKEEADVIKVSMHAFAHIRDKYALLHAGGALGRGCGPLVVARKDSWLRPAPSLKRVAALVDHLGRARVAIPGELTTGALLLGLFVGGVTNAVVMPFDRIMPAVAAGEVDVVWSAPAGGPGGVVGRDRWAARPPWRDRRVSVGGSRTPGGGRARRPRERRIRVR
jgi:1,4-dihydroxy-6-naphthoate synthase